MESSFLVDKFSKLKDSKSFPIFCFASFVALCSLVALIVGAALLYQPEDTFVDPAVPQDLEDPNADLVDDEMKLTVPGGDHFNMGAQAAINFSIPTLLFALLSMGIIFFDPLKTN